MQKTLNTENTQKAMEAAGLNQTEVANHIGVTKESVSQWLNQKTFPRPNKLLQLAKLLSLSFDDLVIKERLDQIPTVAFRKMKGTKTQVHHLEKAQEMGRFLRYLVPHLPFDIREMPPVLKAPINDYEYLTEISNKVRTEIHIDTDTTINFTHLIRRFIELQAVVVPVLWGSKKRHENATHIFLPDSQTTWVYLNLDVNVHDFKFWMAHELGHCLSPSLHGEEAEDFADAFAGALLFPSSQAEQAYARINSIANKRSKLNCIMSIAKENVISPYTVYYQANKFAEHNGLPPIDLEGSIHARVANFNKGHANLSEIIFGDGTETLDAKDYIKKAEEAFDTPFFMILKDYLQQTKKGAGIVQSIMDIPLLDAQSIHKELT